jgi:rhodanese-related sulfurtransferase
MHALHNQVAQSSIFSLYFYMKELVFMKSIAAHDLKKRLDQNEVTLIDVRAPKEHQHEHIAGSHLIPLETVSIEQLPNDNKPIVFHCLAGKRSADACRILSETAKDLDIYTLEGGINAWKEAGLPVERSGSPILPLDQQTQVAIGIITLSGTLLGGLINSFFYVFPFITGAGLIFAGLSGWCGMAKLIAKMPWNQ